MTKPASSVVVFFATLLVFFQGLSLATAQESAGGKILQLRSTSTGPNQSTIDPVAEDGSSWKDPVSGRSSAVLQPLSPASSQGVVPPIRQSNEVQSQNRVLPPVAYLSEDDRSISYHNQLISTEILAPKTVNVNQEAEFRIQVRNLSEDAIDNLKLVALLPEHVSFVTASPKPTRVEGRRFEFDISRIVGSESKHVKLSVVPNEKLAMEIGTQVLVENTKRVLVGVQQPELAIRISGAPLTTPGKLLTHNLTITNVGDGVASGIRLETSLPAGLRQINSTQVPATLLPGASVDIPLESRALVPVQGDLKVVALGANFDSQEVTHGVQVFQPELRISATGPKLNFVQRDGIYTVNIENSGPVEVSNVSVSLAVPRGINVTTISRKADVDVERGVLSWKFDQIGARSTEQIQLKATAVEEGQQVCNFMVSSTETMDEKFQLTTDVTTRADLNVRIKNQSGPVQVGSNAQFVVEVENQGSRDANDITIDVELPDSLMPIIGGKPTDQLVQALKFEQSKVPVGETVKFQFTVLGVGAGDDVVRSILKSDGTERKVITENPVFVYDVSETRVSEALSPVIPR